MPEQSTTPDFEETIRRASEAFNRRDFDAALSIYTPDVVWEFTSLGLGALEGPLIGQEGMRKFLEDLTEAFEDLEWQSEDVHDLGGGVTFGVLVTRSRPHSSNAFVETRIGVVAIWREGRVARVTSYQDFDEARAAAERLAQERG
jgi:ketosteroid isomerase-like protein